MRRFLLALCVLLFSFPVFAQKFEISLAETRASQLLEGLEIREVIDLRTDKSHIGWVRKGMDNERRMADFKTFLSEELKTFTEYNASPIGGSLPVIVKVNELQISERVNGQYEYATAEIALEFLVDKNDGTYCLLLNTGHVVETTDYRDVTSHHEQNLATVIEACFRQAAEKFSKGNCTVLPTRPKSYLSVNSYYQIDPQTIPILVAQSPKKGVYRSFHEFQQNAPGLDEEVERNQANIFVYKAGKKKVRNVWGFSDGVRIYRYYNEDDNYYQLTRKADHFSFKGPIYTTNNSAVTTGAIIGGAIGGAVAGALAQTITIKQIKLNPVSGFIAPADAYNPDTDLNRMATLVIYRKEKGETPEPLSLFINDSLYAQLSPNSVNEFTFKAPVSELNFCLVSKGNACQKVAPALDHTLYFEISQSRKGTGKPVFKSVAAQEAAYYLKIIKHHQTKTQN